MTKWLFSQSFMNSFSCMGLSNWQNFSLYTVYRALAEKSHCCKDLLGNRLSFKKIVIGVCGFSGSLKWEPRERDVLRKPRYPEQLSRSLSSIATFFKITNAAAVGLLILRLQNNGRRRRSSIRSISRPSIRGLSLLHQIAAAHSQKWRRG